MLEGKAKELFNKWYSNKDEYTQMFFQIPWRDIPPSMQWGVIQDFADNFGIYLDVLIDVKMELYNIEILGNKLLYDKKGFKTRPKARTAAIEKLNELINKGL